jgi:hypothetical protein
VNSAKALLRSVVHLSPSASAANAAPIKIGWDPYEVWRTRVLQPRLLSERSAGLAPDARASRTPAAL